MLESHYTNQNIAIDTLPIEIILKIASNLNIKDLNNFSKQNKQINNVIKTHRLTLIKGFLEKYQVDYKDPHNFIYYNEKINGLMCKTFNLQKVFKLYLKHYYKTVIDTNSKNITQIPIYPNLKELYCSNNQITKIPPMPLLKVLYCQDNKITQIYTMPHLQNLYCFRNKLNQIKSFPLLKELSCGDNKLTKIPSMPLLEILSCWNNNLATLPIMPNLKDLWCWDNKLTQIPIMPRLQTLYCKNNRLNLIPPMPLLQELQCDQDVEIQSMPKSVYTVSFF